MSQIGAKPVTAPGWTAKPKNGIAIVDCDVHHNFRHPTQLLPHLSKFWQEHLLDQGLHLGGYPNIPIRSNRVDLKGRIEEAIESTPKNSGGDPRDFNFTLAFMQEEHLDVWNIDVAVLTGPPPFTGILGYPTPIGQMRSAVLLTTGPLSIGLRRTNVLLMPFLSRHPTHLKP